MMADAYDTLTALAHQGANIPPQVLLELAPLQGSVKRKLLAMLDKPDPMVQQAKQITLQGEAAKVDETKSKTAMNLAKAQETAQGGAHGIIERQMDSAMAVDQHRMKMAETGAKVMTEREKTRAKAEQEFAKLTSQRIGAAQDIQHTTIKNILDTRRDEEKHQLQLEAMRAKARAAANGKGTTGG